MVGQSRQGLRGARGLLGKVRSGSHGVLSRGLASSVDARTGEDCKR